MLALLLSSFLWSSPADVKKDSTLIYSLKPNEVMVQLDEHTFLHTSDGPFYVFSTYIRKQGYFIRTSDKRNFGPFELVDSEYFNSGIWWVREKGKEYCLDIYTGKKYGPFDSNTGETRRFSRTEIFAMEETTKGDLLYFNANGKLYATGIHKDTGRLSSELSQRSDGRWVAKYMVVHSKTYDLLKEDSILVYKDDPELPPPGRNVEVRRGDRKKYSSCMMDSLFRDNEFYSMVYYNPFPYNYSVFKEGYHLDTWENAFYHAECSGDSTVIFRDKKKIFSFLRGKYNTIGFGYDRLQLENDYFLPTAGRILERSESLVTVFSRRDQYYAHEKDGIVYVVDKDMGNGYGLVFHEKANSFKWITVHGRSIYQVTFACND